MRETVNRYIESRRIRRGELASDTSFGSNGAFALSKNNVKFFVLASDGGGWDHVSVSCSHRCPTWAEMCWVKELFFDSDEAVMQLHPAESDYVNHHPNCLHLWRPQEAALPLPPTSLV